MDTCDTPATGHTDCTQNTEGTPCTQRTRKNEKFQNITLRLSKQTLHRARILAAVRSTSISGLLAAQIDRIVEDSDEYQAAMHSAMTRMEQGFHLGDVNAADRSSLHER